MRPHAVRPRLRIVDLRSPLAGPFDLALGAGECVAITGPSGSGKSLFLRMIADLDPSQGEVFLDGVERRTMSAPRPGGAGVVYSAAEPGWWHERVANISRACRWGSPARWRHASGSHPLCSMALVVRLSTGERQRLALIRALALASPVLLLDEADRGARRATATRWWKPCCANGSPTGPRSLMVTHSPGAGGAIRTCAICAWRHGAWWPA